MRNGADMATNSMRAIYFRSLLALLGVVGFVVIEAAAPALAHEASVGAGSMGGRTMPAGG